MEIRVVHKSYCSLGMIESVAEILNNVVVHINCSSFKCS